MEGELLKCQKQIYFSFAVIALLVVVFVIMVAYIFIYHKHPFQYTNERT